MKSRQNGFSHFFIADDIGGQLLNNPRIGDGFKRPILYDSIFSIQPLQTQRSQIGAFQLTGQDHKIALDHLSLISFLHPLGIAKCGFNSAFRFSDIGDGIMRQELVAFLFGQLPANLDTLQGRFRKHHLIERR